MTHLSKYLLASLLIVVGCAPIKNKPESLVGSQAWSLNFPDDCVIRGVGSVASVIQCQDLGRAKLNKSTAKGLGEEISRLPKADITIGGSVAKLSSHNSSFEIDHDHWYPLHVRTRTILKFRRIAERERAYVNLPECPLGGVVIRFNNCPSEDELDVCSAPIAECGKALREGQSCDHHIACESGFCGHLPSVCAPVEICEPPLD